MIKITPEEAKDIMATNDDIVILDVRDEDEYEKAHIEGSMLIPVAELEDRAQEELYDMDQTILVHCQSGYRAHKAHKAAKILDALGYTDVREFGGIEDWPYGVV